MRSFTRHGSVLAIALGLLSGPALVQAQDEPAAPAADYEMEEYSYSMPAELNDAPFAMYVDITLLENAWGAKDAQLMTDLALQLAQGEKVLLRSHKAGSSKDLLGLAVKIAQNADDKAALARISQAATALQFEDIVAMAKSSNKLAGASRKDEPALSVSIDQMPAEGFAAYSWMVNQIRNAELLDDKSSLEGFNELIESSEGLSDTQKEYLKRRAGEVQGQPEDPSMKNNQIASTISKLDGASRNDADKAARILFGVGSIVNGLNGGNNWNNGNNGGWNGGHGNHGGWNGGHNNHGGWNGGHGNHGGWNGGHGNHGGWNGGHSNHGGWNGGHSNHGGWSGGGHGGWSGGHHRH